MTSKSTHLHPDMVLLYEMPRFLNFSEFIKKQSRCTLPSLLQKYDKERFHDILVD